MTLLAKAHFIDCRPVSFPRERHVTKNISEQLPKEYTTKGERCARTHFLYNTNLDVVPVESGKWGP